MGWLKKSTHAVAHGLGKATTAVTGSKKAGKVVEKAVKYNPISEGSNLVYQTAHLAGHVQDKIHNALNPKTPDVSVETPEIAMPDYSAYLDQMAAYIAAMNESMNRVEPAQEPLKQAQTEMSEARADTEKKQLRRRGLMSTYTRYGSTGGTQKLGA